MKGNIRDWTRRFFKIKSDREQSQAAAAFVRKAIEAYRVQDYEAALEAAQEAIRLEPKNRSAQRVAAGSRQHILTRTARNRQFF